MDRLTEGDGWRLDLSIPSRTKRLVELHTEGEGRDSLQIGERETGWDYGMLTGGNEREKHTVGRG